MDYEVVTLEKKVLAGLKARTSNASPEMGAVIGGLWQKFFNEGVYAAIPNKKNAKAIGLYSNYASDQTGEYDISVCCEVEQAERLPEGVTAIVIPEGKYAKFEIQGHMEKAVREHWEKLWEMDLPRAFTYDFEEYQNDDMENAIIHIYISLTDEA